MEKHYAMPAWDEGYEYIGLWEETTAPPSAIECSPPENMQHGGYVRYNPSIPGWYWPAAAVLRYERVWRDQQWPEADHGERLAERSNAKAVGTLQDWHDYKNALCDWPDHPSIEPDSALRPQKPTAS